MPSPRPSLTACAIAAGIVFASASSWAQQQPVNPANPTQTGPTDKPEGVAEKAPERRDLLPTVPVLPPEKSEKRAFELLELNGYFRFRGDWFKRFDQSFNFNPDFGGGPFPNASACQSDNEEINPPPPQGGGQCEDTLKSANMRLRLEPVINLNEKTRVKMQIDVLDNVVLGSTPDTFVGADADAVTVGELGDNSLIGAFSGGQVAPERGRNSISDSLRVRQAWAEVATGFGLIKFGRMPDHWGLGVVHNGGGHDPVHNTYDLDADFGDTEDRIEFSTMIPGTDFLASVAMDWSSVTPTALQSDIFNNRYRGQPFDLEDNDDVNQWVFKISRIDSHQVFRDKVADGELALNYGIYFQYRTQTLDSRAVVVGAGTPADQLVPRDLQVYQPDGWLRLAWHDLELEVEANVAFGSIDRASDLGITSDQLDIRQFGGVARGTYHLLDRDLRFGFELGWASGDQADNDPQGAIHVSNAVLPSGNDTTLNQFFFDFDYKIDLILFRELMGTVSNAIYARPSLEYDITDQLRGRGQSVISFAHKPVATPGNASAYGAELDLDLGYHDDDRGFSAGLAYGVLFPFAALNHPADDGNAGGPGFGFLNVGDASTSHTFQFRMALKF